MASMKYHVKKDMMFGRTTMRRILLWSVMGTREEWYWLDELNFMRLVLENTIEFTIDEIQY